MCQEDLRGGIEDILWKWVALISYVVWYIQYRSNADIRKVWSFLYPHFDF